MKVAHTADIHIDQTHHAPALVGLGNNAAVVRQMVEGAIERGVSAFVHAGDAFAHGRPSPEAVLRMAESLTPLLRANIAVVLIEGNHERLRHRSDQRTVTSVLAHMLGKHGEVHVVEREPTLVKLTSGLQMACLPWLDTFEMLKSAGKLDEPEPAQHQFIAKEAVNALASLCERADGDALMAVSHLTVAQSQRSSERDLTALFREPVVKGQDLSDLPADYVALGHIHSRQRLAPGVWYSGSPQRLTFTDEHDTKGWNLVDLETRHVHHIPTDAQVFHTIDLDKDMPPVAPESFVRLLLREGEHVPPEYATKAVEQAGARVVRVVRRLDEKSESTKQQFKQDVSPEAALREWVSENYPDINTDDVVTKASSL